MRSGAIRDLGRNEQLWSMVDGLVRMEAAVAALMTAGEKRSRRINELSTSVS